MSTSFTDQEKLARKLRDPVFVGVFKGICLSIDKISGFSIEKIQEEIQ
jgi:hypothetical protein